MRHPASQGRRDANHAELAEMYEDLYCNVIDLSHVGFGCPDIAIALSGRMYLREVKTQGGKPEASQTTFIQTWRGPKIETMRTVADVIQDVQTIRERIARGA